MASVKEDDKPVKIANSTNVNELVQAVKDSQTIIKAVFDNISKIKDVEQIGKMASNLNKIKKTVVAFTGLTISVVNELVKTHNVKQLKEILAVTEEIKDKATGEIIQKKGDLTTINMLVSIGKIIDQLMKTTETLATKDLGNVSQRKLRRNLKFLQRNLAMTANVFLDVLNGIAYDPSIEDKLKLFYDSPDVKTIDNIIQKDGTTKSESSQHREQTVSGTKGLFSLIVTMLDINDRVAKAEFTMGNWAFGRHLAKYKARMEAVVDNLVNILTNIVGRINLDSDGVKLYKEKADAVLEVMTSFVDTMDEICDTLSQSKLKPEKMKTILAGYYDLYNIIYLTTESEPFKNLSSEAVQQSIENFLEAMNIYLGGIVTMAGQLAKITWLYLSGLGKAAGWAVKGVIKIIFNILEMFNKMPKNDVTQAKLTMENLSGVIKSILGVASLLSLGGVLFLTGALGGLALLLMLQPIKWIINIITAQAFVKDLKQARKTTLELLLVIGSLFAVTIALTGFGAWVIQFWKPLILGMLATAALIAAIWGLFWLISQMQQVALESLKTLAIIGLAVLIVLVLVGMVVMLAQMVEEVSWEAMLKVGVIIVAIIGIIALAAFASTFIEAGAIAIALIGLAMILMVAPLLILVKALKELETLDAATAMANMKTLLIGFIEAIASTFTPKNVGYMMLATVSMGMLTMIALGLSAAVGAMALVDKVEINPDTVSEKLTKVLTCITDAIGKVNDVEVGFKTLGKFAALNLVSLSLAGMAATIAAVADLKMADKWDKDGKPINFIPMTEEHFKTATQNVVRIATAIAGCLTSPEMEEFLNTKYKKGEENLKLIGALGNSVAGMVQGVKAMAEGRIAIYEEDGKTIKEYIDIDKLLKDPKEQEKIKQNLQGLLSIYVEAVTNSELKKQSKGTGPFGLGASNIQKAATTLQSIVNDVIPAMTEIINSTAELIKNENLKTYLSGEAGQQNIEWLDRNLQSLLEVFIISSVNEYFVNQSYQTLQSLNDNLIPSLDQFLKSIDELLKLESSKTYLLRANAVKNSQSLGVNLISLFDNMLVVNSLGLPTIISARSKLSFMVDIAKDYNKLFRKIAKLEPYMKPMDNVIKTYKRQVNDYIDIIRKIESISLDSLTQVETIVSRIQQLFQNGVSVVTSRGGLFRKKTTTVVDNFKKPLESISKIVDKVNSVDAEKVKSTADMFAQISKLSESIKGNFNGLARTLNENLMEVLQELKDILEQTNGIIENRPSGSSSTQMPQIQNIPSTSQNQEAPQKPVDMTPVIEKLEGLLQAFKGGVPVYNKVGTRLQINTTV